VRGHGWRVAQDNARRLERLEELRVLLSSKGTAEVVETLAELGLRPKHVGTALHHHLGAPGHLEVVVDVELLEGDSAVLRRTVVPGEDVALALVRAGQGAVALHGPDITLTRAYLQWVGYVAEEVPR